MALTSDEVRHIATLARMALDDEEVARLRVELSGILAHFEALDGLDVDGVPPTAQVFDRANVQRDDTPRPSAGSDAVLSNAPRREDGFFRVRAVLD